MTHQEIIKILERAYAKLHLIRAGAQAIEQDCVDDAGSVAEGIASVTDDALVLLSEIIYAPHDAESEVSGVHLVA